MSHILRAMPTLFRIGAAQAVAYRAELVIWVLTATLPLVMLALWDAVALAGPVAGFDRADFARYYTLTLVARQLTAAWVIWELNEEIRTGGLSPALLRPFHPLWRHAINNVCAMPLRIVVIAPLVAALMLWRPEMALGAEPWRVVAFLASCALAWGLAFVNQALFGCLAFWLDQSMGLWGAWFGLWSLLGGYLLPVALLPGPLAAIAMYLPFRAMLGTPVEIGAGLVPLERLPLELGVQAAWLAAGLALLVFTWRRGVRRYGAFGA